MREVKPMQPEKASLPMLVTVFGIVTMVFPAGQYIKALLALLKSTPSSELY
jgi:hypothetical protein